MKLKKYSYIKNDRYKRKIQYTFFLFRIKMFCFLDFLNSFFNTIIIKLNNIHIIVSIY